MKLTGSQRRWNKLATVDPMWAILTDPAKKNRGWEAEEFYKTGESEIAGLMQYAAQVGLPAHRGRALDFGCGMGRLSRALADYFDEVRGVDISPVMVDLARKHNADQPKCQFIVNSESDLSALPSASFDLIYSSITLQHIPPKHIRTYIREFLRLLAPQGLLVFQLPSEYTGRGLLSRSQRLNYWAFRLLRPGELGLEMYALPKDEVTQILKQSGGKVLDVTPSDCAGDVWLSFRYAVTNV